MLLQMGVMHGPYTMAPVASASSALGGEHSTLPPRGLPNGESAGATKQALAHYLIEKTGSLCLCLRAPPSEYLWWVTVEENRYPRPLCPTLAVM